MLHHRSNALEDASPMREPASPLTILHVLAPAQFGGLEEVVRRLATGHAELGHDVHVAAVVPDTDHPFLRSWPATVHVHPLVLGSREYRRQRNALRSLIRQLAPDVVHTHGYRSDVLDSPPARSLGVPTVSTAHGFTGGGIKNRFYEWLQVRSYRRFAAVVAVSRSIEARLVQSGTDASRIHRIANAWGAGPPLLTRAEARAVLGIAPDVALVGWVGRLSHEKGPDVFVEAFARVSDLPVHAVLVGAGPLASNLTERCISLGLAGRVHWTGPIDAAARLFAAFDAFVLSSRTEGTPMVLFEAMHAGVPVIATRVGGVPDVVGDAEALLVEPDDPVALGDALRRLLTDAESTHERARVARERLASTFAATPWLRRYEELYRSVAAVPRATGFPVGRASRAAFGP